MGGHMIDRTMRVCLPPFCMKERKDLHVTPVNRNAVGEQPQERHLLKALSASELQSGPEAVGSQHTAVMCFK